MSELMNRQPSGLRKQLLTTVSALALIGSVHDANAASNPGDRPPLWIELGGQWESASNEPDTFSAPFFSLAPPANLDPLVNAQRPSRNSIGGEGKVTFLPEDTNWVLTAEVRYGRSNSAKHLHHQTPAHDYGNVYIGSHSYTAHWMATKFAFGDGQTTLGSSHLVTDFQAGKDVGLGLFGRGGTSVVSAGVRFAQFTSASDVTLHARPFLKVKFITSPGKYRIPAYEYRGDYTATFEAKRSTHAIGPTLSWEASQSVAGNASDMTLDFDWGANAAILFGRQRTSVRHQTTGRYYNHLSGGLVHSYANPPISHDRSRTVTIPNVGGFVGASLKFPNAKVSLGYRADFFFGAMDSGIDTVKKENVGFYGPFASVSVGIGG